MTKLRRLNEGGHGLIGEGFFSGEEELTIDDLRPYLTDTGIRVDLEPLREKIDKDVFENDDYDQGSSKIDREVAATVHQTIDITRRQAAIEGIWHYLTVLEFPDFVRYRWDSGLREKFLEGGEDIYSNALHRLWWIAEMTEDDGDYSRTEEIFEMQELANDIADRWFARYEPVTFACVDVLKKDEIDDLGPANSEIVSKTTTRLREELTVVCAEGLEHGEAVKLVKELRKEIVADLS
jgi:hypothetical protein